jgi:hypothetical protein
MRSVSLSCVLAVCASVLRAPAVGAQPAEPVVALDLRPNDPAAIDATVLRERVAAELAMRVVAPGEEPASEGTLTVGVHRDTGELSVEYRNPSGETLTRRVPLPETAAAVMRIAVFLAGNMVRDESRSLVRDLKGAAAPAEVPGREPASEPVPAAPPAPLAPTPVKAHRFWIGIGAEAAWTMAPAASDACAPSSGYYCLTDGGQPFTSSPGLAAVTPPAQHLALPTVRSGLAGAGTRFAVSLDYAATDNWLVGGRLGYAIGQYPGSTSGSQPKPWGPLHLEARASYVLGEHALAQPGVRLAITIGAGLGEWDARVPVEGMVVVQGTPGTINPSPVALSAQSIYAWRVQAGPFVSLGAGPRWSFGDRFAILANVGKLTALASLMGSTGTGVSVLFTPELSFEVAL